MTWGGRQEFVAAVQAWADRLEMCPAEIVVRPMRRKWASCSSRGRLTFDAGLLDIDREFGEYVIVHELLHLKVPNHGPVFSALLSAYLPDWRRRMTLSQARLTLRPPLAP
jgi:predicted metal-dependent hydrolase